MTWVSGEPYKSTMMVKVNTQSKGGEMKKGNLAINDELLVDINIFYQKDNTGWGKLRDLFGCPKYIKRPSYNNWVTLFTALSNTFIIILTKSTQHSPNISQKMLEEVGFPYRSFETTVELKNYVLNDTVLLFVSDEFIPAYFKYKCEKSSEFLQVLKVGWLQNE